MGRTARKKRAQREETAKNCHHGERVAMRGKTSQSEITDKRYDLAQGEKESQKAKERIKGVGVGNRLRNEKNGHRDERRKKGK